MSNIKGPNLKKIHQGSNDTCSYLNFVYCLELLATVQPPCSPEYSLNFKTIFKGRLLNQL